MARYMKTLQNSNRTSREGFAGKVRRSVKKHRKTTTYGANRHERHSGWGYAKRRSLAYE
jgi:hypothetical protein